MRRRRVDAVTGLRRKKIDPRLVGKEPMTRWPTSRVVAHLLDSAGRTNSAGHVAPDIDVLDLVAAATEIVTAQDPVVKRRMGAESVAYFNAPVGGVRCLERSLIHASTIRSAGPSMEIVHTPHGKHADLESSVICHVQNGADMGRV